MGLLRGLFRTVTAPIEIVARTVDDILNGDTGLAIVTLGLSSVVKGVAKTAKGIIEEIED